MEATLMAASFEVTRKGDNSERWLPRALVPDTRQ
jgi:hypothetical protein